MTLMIHPPYSPNLPLSDFSFVCFFPLDEKKSSKVNQKMAEALKASKLTSSKTVLSTGKDISIGVLHQMDSILKVT